MTFQPELQRGIIFLLLAIIRNDLKTYQALSEIQYDLQSGTITCAGLVRSYLDEIVKKQNLNAFLEVYEREAIANAQLIDQKIKECRAGKLAGLVIGVKDVIAHKGHKLSAASKILEGFESLFTSSALQRLLDEDVIVIGRLNCDEFAMGSSNEHSAYGVVRNPLDPSRVPGGSSGGSAVAVKAGLCHASLGSDTGGSVRQPASFCDLIGLKPSYGRISRYGLVAYASSFDQIGIFTHSIEDAAILLELMSGADGMDSTASSEPVPHYGKFLARSEKSRVAYFKECIHHKSIDHEIRKRLEEICAQLKDQGHIVEEVEFPLLDFLVPAYYILTAAEASSNLSRYSGIHYGVRSKNSHDLLSTYSASRTEGFGKEVQRRILLGTFILSEGYYDAYYGKAQKMRRLIRDQAFDILDDYDFILMPSSPNTAFRFNEKSDPVTMYLEDIFTVLANLCGLPAISLPLGRHSNGMPFGIQLISGRFQEGRLLAFSNQICKKFRVLA